MTPAINVLSEYENYIRQFSDLQFTMEQLDRDEQFTRIIKQIIQNNRLLQEAFAKYPEFIYAHTSHIDNEGKFSGNKVFIKAPSTMSSFITTLIMGRYH